MEMREALSAAFEEHTSEEQQPPETVETQQEFPTTPVEEPPEPAVESEGGELGKEAAETSPSDATKQKAEKPAEEASPQGQHRVDRPPQSWRKEAKGEWAAVPLHIRQEVHRREMEVQRVLNEAAHGKQQTAQYEQIAQPYMARIQSLGATPQQAFQHLLNADYQLATGSPQQKAQLIDKLLQDYGVDIATLDQVISARLGGTQQPQPQQPDIQQLVQQQLNQALAPLYQQQQQAQQQAQRQAELTIEQMSLDPKFPHFDEVRNEMADLIELKGRRGIYMTPEQAYNAVVSSNPELSAMTRATQQHQQAQVARAASASVSGAPASGGMQQHVSAGNIRDDIIAAMNGGRL